MPEFNILEKAGLPQVKKRTRSAVITGNDKKIAENLDFSFYDSDRSKGYGGYYYDGRWKSVAEIITERYGLNENSKVLIDRCHKGFLVFDLMELIPGILVYGVHPSEYPINHAMDGYGKWAISKKIKNKDPTLIEMEVKQSVMRYLIKSHSNNLPFKDNFFNTVISIESACAYAEKEGREVIKEIIRVSKNNGKNCYIQNDSWRNKYEEKKLKEWTFLCKTFLNVEEWEKLFMEEKYNGDWGFTIIQ